MARRQRRKPVVTTVEGVTRTEAVEALTAVRATILGVPVRDLRAAILNTRLDRLRTLVVHDGALACSLREEVS